MLVKDDEPLSEIKPRIQAKLGVSDEEWVKWRFAFLPGRTPEWLEDSDVVAERCKAHTGQLAEVRWSPLLLSPVFMRWRCCDVCL